MSVACSSYADCSSVLWSVYMKTDNSDKYFELELKMQEVISLMFVLCEEHLKITESKPSPRSLALTASALAAEKAIAAHLAVARTLR